MPGKEGCETASGRVESGAGRLRYRPAVFRSSSVYFHQLVFAASQSDGGGMLYGVQSVA